MTTIQPDHSFVPESSERLGLTNRATDDQHRRQKNNWEGHCQLSNTSPVQRFFGYLVPVITSLVVLVRSVQGMEAAVSGAVRAELISLCRGS